ncbi:acyl carrier protein [Chelativorans sp. Marseille-P2723]|uniref:acyl carrier protein n=1 Tax=Chelativorans sp. Marseille-P2723 TaxID=2709133 RepID=UPI00156F7CE6|nr:acyl carrier protein [Chelativorans sp. Marseille-P2723]
MTYAESLIAREIVAEALGCPIEDVPCEAKVGSLPQWDSIAHVSIIAAAEERLGRMMTAEEIASFETVGSLAALFGAAHREDES